MSAIDEIKHVVVLMLENNSFDQMLGCMSAVYDGQNGRDRLEGVDSASPNSNADDRGGVFQQRPTVERQMNFDPMPEVEHVAIQLEGGNSGFVRDFTRKYPAASHDDRQNIMGYYPLDFLPALHPLARNFTVCDHWFASLPGPTWPNRFFALSGTASGRVDMPGDGTSGADLPGFFAQIQDTIFDRLNERQINWKVYFHDIPQSWVLKQPRAPHNAAHYFYIRQFHSDARGVADDFPEFSLIEPDYMGYGENDDHPPHDVMKAQKLIADVYNALRGNEELWASTLLVIFYDEHGGFYDHVVPPAAVPPDGLAAPYPGARGDKRFSFNQLGIRVPAILASPWVKAGVVNTVFDHTSLLKFVSEKWDLRPLDSKRVAAANSIGIALNQSRPRTETIQRITLTPEQLKVPDPELEDEAFGGRSDYHKGLKQLSGFLSSALWEETRKLAVTEAPQLYTWSLRLRARIKQSMAASLDTVRGWCEHGMAALYETSGHKFVLGEPDKVDLKHAAERNQVIRFIGTQKARAMKGLTARIDDPQKFQDDRQSVRTLSNLTGRAFHKFDRRYAVKWLRRAKPPS